MESQGSLSVNHQETARRPAGWPSDKRVWSLTAFFLAALVVPRRIALEYAQHWSELGSHYLPHYVVSAVGPSGLYWILNTAPVADSLNNVGRMPFQSTPTATARLRRSPTAAHPADNAKPRALLRTRVYHVRPLSDLARQGVTWAGVFLVFGRMVAVPRGRKAQRMHQEWRVVRGPGWRPTMYLTASGSTAAFKCEGAGKPDNAESGNHRGEEKDHGQDHAESHGYAIPAE